MEPRDHGAGRDAHGHPEELQDHCRAQSIECGHEPDAQVLSALTSLDNKTAALCWCRKGAVPPGEQRQGEDLGLSSHGLSDSLWYNSPVLMPTFNLGLPIPKPWQDFAI